MEKQIINSDSTVRASQAVISTELKKCYIKNPIGLLNFLTQAGICRQARQLFIQIADISTKDVSYFVQGNCVLSTIDEIQLDLPFIVLESVEGTSQYNAYLCSCAA